MRPFVAAHGLALAWAAVCFPSLNGAFAQTSYVWKGGSGHWGAPENWTPPGVPGADDEATISSGTVNLDAPAMVRALNFAGGWLVGDGVSTIEVTQAGQWSGGVISNLRLVVRPAAAFTFAGAEKTLQGGGGIVSNAGTLIWTSGRFNLENNALLHNLPGALFDVQTDSEILQSGPGTSVLRNEGIYQKSAGAGTNSIQIVSFINDGLLRATRGAIRIQASSVTATAPGNTFDSEEASSVVIERSISSVSFSDTVFSGSGVKSISTASGTITLSGAIAATNLHLVSGDYQGVAELQGVCDWWGGSIRAHLTIPIGSLLSLRGPAPKTLSSGGVITNRGVVLWVGGQFNLDNNVAFQNQPGALFEAQTDSPLIQNVGGTSIFNNEGIYRKSVGAGTNVIQIVSFLQSGALEINRGVVRVVGSLNLAAESELRSATVSGPAGFEFGRLQVTGALGLGGILGLDLAEGFSPALGQSFALITAGQRLGAFGSVAGSAVGGGLYLNPVYAPNGVTLTVIDATPTFSQAAWSDGGFHANLHGAVGGTYEIHASTNLMVWESLGTTVIPGSGIREFSDNDPTPRPARHYQASFLP